MQEKIRKLQGQIKEIDLDALIVTNPVNIFYLTGIANFDSEKGFLLVVNAKDWRLITSRFYQSRVEGAIPVKNTVYVERGGSMSENAAEILAKDENIGFERDTISYLQYENLKKARRGKKLLPESDLVARMRTTKNETELALVKKAAAITDKTFLELTKLIKPGVAELFLKRKVLEIMQDLGASGCSFDPIVASGKNAADPHYEGSNKKLKSGEMIVIDIGARYKNYDADLTRMVFVGKATAKYKELYRIVAETQEKALKDCVIGTPVKQIFDNCVANFKHYNQDEHFTHGLGHGVGIQIHEEPSLSPGGAGNLENGMVFTVEPGLYHLGWGGIRIEDLCTMCDGKLKLLSKSPKHLIEI